MKTLYGIRKLYIKPGTNIGDVYEMKNHGPLGSLMINISGMIMPVVHDMESDPLAVEEKTKKEIEEEEKEIERNKSLSAGSTGSS